MTLYANNLFEEIIAIFTKWQIWFMLGTQDIKLRYRRSTMGPLWITISTAITIGSMGFLYGHLFKLNLHQYIPFLASGIIGWTFLSTFLLESGNAFIESEGYIKNQESFMSLFMMRSILRNFIIFLHNLIVFIPIIFIFHLKLNLYTLLIIPGLSLITINMVFWGNLLATLGTRYRDFPPTIASLIQVIFFLTPVMWMPSLLPPEYRWAVALNPFSHFLTLIRAPLLGQPIPLDTCFMMGAITTLGALLYFYFFKQYKNRIVFWL